MFDRRVAACGRLGLGFALVLVVSLALAGPAAADSVHPFVGSFGSFGFPQSVAVDESTGDVYVLDASSNTVLKFDASGNPSSFSALGTNVLDGAGGGNCPGTPADCDQTPQNGLAFDGNDASQVAVDNSSGPAQHDIYVTNSFNGVVSVFDQTGTYVGQIDGTAATPQSGGEVCGVAVSPSGDVYVSSVAGHVDRYTPADANPAHDAFVSQLENLSASCNVAVDSTGAAYVVPMGSGAVSKYGASQFGLDSPTGSTVDNSGTAVSVDTTNDDVYVDEGNQIAQYDAVGTLLGHSGAGKLGSSFGVAIRGMTGDLFASDASTGQVDQFGPAISVNQPTVAIGSVTGVTSSTATFNGTVNPQGTTSLSDTTWHFEYSTDGGNSWTSTTGGNAGTGTSDVPVSDQVTSFLPDQSVQVRLVATNGAATVTSSVVSFTTTAVAPDATTQPAEDVATTHASLQGFIDAHNAPTTYWFEWGTTTAYGHSEPAGQNGDAGSDNLLEAFANPIYGLRPGTTYHYRLVARNVAGTMTGADQSFTTTTPVANGPCPNDQFRHGAAGALPDCRAWEMVSPPEKNGGEVMTHMQRTHAASGESPTLPMAVAFASSTGFGDVHGITVTSEYMAQRTLTPDTNGWATHAITPRQQPGNLLGTIFGAINDPLFVGDFSSDLTHAVFRSMSPVTDAPNVADVPDLYTRNDLRTPGPGSWTLLTNASAPLQGSLAKPLFEDASADFTHVIFESFESLTPDVPPCNPQPPFGASCPPHLYEAVNGVVRLAGVLPDDSPAAASAAGQPGPQFAGQVLVSTSPHTISSDGRRIFFTDTSTGDLYMRVDGTSTVQLDTSESSAPSGSGTYWDASADGGRVFFTSGAQLTPDAVGVGGTHLYMYSVQPDSSGRHLTRLDVDREPADPPNDVLGVLGASDDGHYVYFAAAGQLVAGKPVGASDRHLYVWHDESGTPRVDYIGRIPGTDLAQNLLSADWFHDPPSAEVTPDGRHLLFGASDASDGNSLTGYDQTSACAGGFDSFAGCTELYVYSVDGDGPDHAHLHCASCNPSGAPATSDATDTARVLTGFAQPTDHMPRAISADGRFVFFNTGDALVPQDVNGKYDAYEYDLADGSVHLLSSGTDTSDSFFLDASADGHDAFFTTREQLVGWDQDTSRDLYDARIGGGVPGPVPGFLPCSDDACQGLLSAAPSAPSIGSATAQGSGNVRATPPQRKPLTCRRGYVKKRVRHRLRCVKKPRRHRARARRARHASHSVHADRKGR